MRMIAFTLTYICTCIIAYACNDDEFPCKDNRTCISYWWRCDGENDCPDSSDENNCDKCSKDTFHCEKKRKCISILDRCDGYDHCRDYSDEKNCASSICPATYFRCASGQCLHQEDVCDGYEDCRDGEDEAFTLCKISSSSLAIIILVIVLVIVLAMNCLCFGIWRCRNRQKQTTLDSPINVEEINVSMQRQSSSQSVYNEIGLYQQSGFTDRSIVKPRPYTVLTRDPHSFNESYGPQHTTLDKNQVSPLLMTLDSIQTSKHDQRDVVGVYEWLSLPNDLNAMSKKNKDCPTEETNYIDILPTQLEVFGNGLSKSMPDVRPY